MSGVFVILDHYSPQMNAAFFIPNAVNNDLDNEFSDQEYSSAPDGYTDSDSD